MVSRMFKGKSYDLDSLATVSRYSACVFAGTTSSDAAISPLKGVMYRYSLSSPSVMVEREAIDTQYAVKSH